MARTTIDFGIDLGTTNSSIAERSGGKVHVFKNNEDRESIPSAVFIDKSNNLIVGRNAKERVESDPGNAFCEFKLQMGTGRDYHFEHSGRKMKPEELSMEVLQELLASVQKQTGKRPEAAVITVPAAFELPQCDATMKAAKLAGLQVSPLLQEPVAAALAYGFQNEREGAYWLVYDFGGGTFDAAVISVRDGMIDVVTHEGDNHLGGKSIDWAIVDELLIPAVAKKYRVTDFGRKNLKWRGAIAKLKGAAEEAKIQLSRSESTDIYIDFLCQDDQGTPIEFEYALTRKNVERLAEPLILKSIHICKTSLASKRLGADAIEKVLLVGGPSRMPYLRSRLEEELKIPLEFGIDPMTIVAQGAAIFASMQRFETAPAKPTVQGEFALALEGKRVGPDTEPLFGGKVLGDGGGDLSAFTIELINKTTIPAWRSGKIGLAPDGSFMTNLWAEKGRVNRFDIELCDAIGKTCKTTPDHWEYEVGLGFSEQPMIHSLRVGLANNDTLLFVEKGTSLPARKRKIMATAFPVTKGQTDSLLRIPVIEGENARADRNKRIGELIVSADNAKRDLPAGTDVDVTIEVDASRIVRVKAWIPVLDEEFETTLELGGQKLILTTNQLNAQVRHEKARLEQLRKKAEEANELPAVQVLQRIDSERMLHEVERALDVAGVDQDAADKCEKGLMTLRLALDELESILDWPALVREAEGDLERSKELIQAIGSAADKQASAILEREIRQSLAAREADMLRRKVGELSGLRLRLLMDHGPTMVAWLQDLEQQQGQMRDQPQAQQLVAQGHRAIQTNDVQMLKGALMQLVKLLPSDVPPPMPTFGGTLRQK
jgi:molecular chaperone DnaK